MVARCCVGMVTHRCLLKLRNYKIKEVKKMVTHRCLCSDAHLAAGWSLGQRW